MLTQERLKEVLHYNPDTGIFTNRIFRCATSQQGEITGYPHKDGYIQTGLDGKSYLLHRLAFLYMLGRFPEEEVDHINHKRDDNRWLNIREVTRFENQNNATKRSDNTSGITGVKWDKKMKKWIATIGFDGERIGLYSGDIFEHAVFARMKAEEEYGYHENHGANKC